MNGEKTLTVQHAEPVGGGFFDRSAEGEEEARVIIIHGSAESGSHLINLKRRAN